jgi:Family of unknown function (DUF6084)
MPDLSFQVERAGVVPYAAAPQLALKLRLANSDPDEVIHTVALRCQIMMEVTRRRYGPQEQAQLRDLFGEPERWSQTLRNMLWTHTSTVVSAFQGSTVVELPVPCTFDFNVAATKYFSGLEEGDVPLCLQFSGTVFYAHSNGALQVMPIAWDKEARFRLPVRLWRQMMDTYYPNSAWLCLRRDVFDRLYEYKMRHGIPTWEQALERVLPAEEAVRP